MLPMSVAPIPAGPRVRPYLACHDAAAAIEFYREVFGMELRSCLRMGESIAHAELTGIDIILYVSDEFPQMGVTSPKSLGGRAVSLMLYVEDVDAVVATALQLGATQEGETKDEFHGDRSAKIVDPFGHRWFVSTRIEEVSQEEVERRFAKMMGG